MNGLEHKNAWIAGGGRGIGRAIAEKLAGCGAHVVVGSRTETEYAAVAEHIKNQGGRAAGLPLDVGDTTSVEDFVREACNAFGEPDILVYCAGINTRLPAEEYPPDAWERVLNVNLTGAYRMCKATGKRMIENQTGSIVTITSMLSHIATPHQSAYAASKGALLQYTKLLAVEWARFNIRVNSVSPGYIATDLNAELRKQPSFRDPVIEKTPQKRFGKTGEVAEAVAFLASPGASFITGVDLPVDGGFLAGHPAIIPSSS